VPDGNGESLDGIGSELDRSAQTVDLGPVVDARGQLVEMTSARSTLANAPPSESSTASRVS